MEKDRPRLKQEICLPLLLQEAQKGCKDIKGSVTRQVNISLSDCLMSEVAMFGLKYPSLLQFDQDYRDENALLQHNLRSLYGIEHVPSDTYFRERVDEIEPRAPQGIINNVISLLKKRQVFERYKYLDEYAMCNFKVLLMNKGLFL